MRSSMDALARRVTELQLQNDVARLRLRLDAQRQKEKGTTRSGAPRRRSKKISFVPPPGQKAITIKSPRTNANIAVGGRKNKVPDED